MTTSSNSYPMTAGDLMPLRLLLAAQSSVGAGMPAVTAASMAAFMQQLDALSKEYPTIQNPVLKSNVDQLYTLLTGIQTNYSQPFPALYITYWYRHLRRARSTWATTTRATQ